VAQLPQALAVSEETCVYGCLFLCTSHPEWHGLKKNLFAYPFVFSTDNALGDGRMGMLCWYPTFKGPVCLPLLASCTDSCATKKVWKCTCCTPKLVVKGNWVPLWQAKNQWILSSAQSCSWQKLQTQILEFFCK